MQQSALDYATNYAARDRGPRYILANPPEEVLWSNQIIPAEERAHCPVQNELLPRYRAGSRSWIYAPSIGGQVYVLTLLHESSMTENLPLAKRQALEKLSHHIHQAIRLHMALEQARRLPQTLELGFEAVGYGIAMLDGSLHPVYVSKRAEAFFATAGLDLADLASHKTSGKLSDTLIQLVTRALGLSGRKAGGAITFGNLTIQAVPANERSAFFGAGVVLLIRQRSSQLIQAADLASLSLTSAEAELVAGLASGKTMKEIAKEKRRSIDTVRAQLKSVFSKTGTRRQSELILLVLGLAEKTSLR